MGIYAWVSGNKATEGSAAGETRSSRTSASETMRCGCQQRGSCVCIWESVCPEAPSGRWRWLWPPGLICSSASNWEDWQPGAAVEQLATLSDPICWRHPHWTYVYVYFPVMNLQPDQTDICLCMPVVCTGYTCSASLLVGPAAASPPLDHQTRNP